MGREKDSGGKRKMFQEEYQAVVKTGYIKSRFLKKNPAGYFISSLIAGMFIAVGGFVAFTLGSIVSEGEVASLTKVFQAMTFASALSLIVMAGAELFTGNNFVMASASLRKQVSWFDTIRLWITCWCGNFIGSVLSAFAFQLTGIPNGKVGAYFAAIAEGKMAIEPLPLFIRAIFCNILVCLAVWCSIKLKSETGKLIMVFWCIMIFMICGFEHSIANMSVMCVGLLNGGGTSVSLSGYFYNIGIASVGNLIGAVVFLAIPYHMITKEIEE